MEAQIKGLQEDREFMRWSRERDPKEYCLSQVMKEVWGNSQARLLIFEGNPTKTLISLSALLDP